MFLLFALHFVSYLDMNGTVSEADGKGYFNCHLTVVRKMKSREVIDDKRFWNQGEIIEMISSILCFRLHEGDFK